LLFFLQIKKEEVFMGSKHYTQSERLGFIKEFKSSGLSQRLFSRQHRINAATFNSWVKRYLKKNDAPAGSKVLLSAVELGCPTSPKTVEVELLNRIKVHVPCERGSDLFDLIRGLSRC
jgi:transposase-like protein